MISKEYYTTQYDQGYAWLSMPYAFSQALTLHNQCWPCTNFKALHNL